MRQSVVVAGVMLLVASRGAEAQDARPPAAVEMFAGYKWVDDSGNHGLIGAGMRFYLWPRLSVSPRVTYERTYREQPGDHSDLSLETALAFEFRRPVNGRPRTVSPFVLVSGGFWAQRFIHKEWEQPEPIWGTMVGVRVFVPVARGKVYVAPDVGLAPLIVKHTPNYEDALIQVAAPLTVGMPLR